MCGCRLILVDSLRHFVISSAALGLGSNEHSEKQDRKSIGTQRTFRALSDRDQLLEKLRQVADEVVTNLKQKRLKGRKVTLFYKTTEFEMRSKTHSLLRFTDSYDEICMFCTPGPSAIEGEANSNALVSVDGSASRLLISELPIDLRLIGIRVSDFPKAVTPPDDHQRTLSQFFKNNPPTKVETKDDYEDDIFEVTEESAKPSNPLVAFFPSESKRIYQENPPNMDSENDGIEITAETKQNEEKSDEISIIGIVDPSSSEKSKKRMNPTPAIGVPPPKKAKNSSSSSSSKTKPASKGKRPGQSTLELFMKPGS